MPTAQPFRIAQVAGSADWGGGERYLELLARHLDRARFHLEVVVPAEGALRGRLEALGVPVHVAELGRLVSIRALGRLRALLVRLEPDLVQSHGARSNFYARLAARLARVPVHVSTVHNSLRDYPVGVARKTLYQAMDRLTLPLASRVLCVADALACEYGGRAVVIHNGVDLDEFDPASAAPERVRAELGLGKGPVVGFVGRLTPQKDPLTFVSLVGALRRDLPGLQALVVGDGPLRTVAEREAARLGLDRACRFTGARGDIPTVLGALDLFVLSSVSEGFPFVVLEAMAMERPVVATAVNGVPELVEHGVTGLVVPPADEAALARAALDILRSPARARAMGRAARARVAERFTSGLTVDRTATLYVELIARAGGRRGVAGAGTTADATSEARPPQR